MVLKVSSGKSYNFGHDEDNISLRRPDRTPDVKRSVLWAPPRKREKEKPLPLSQLHLPLQMVGGDHVITRPFLKLAKWPMPFG